MQLRTIPCALKYLTWLAPTSENRIKPVCNTLQCYSLLNYKTLCFKTALKCAHYCRGYDSLIKVFLKTQSIPFQNKNLLKSCTFMLSVLTARRKAAKLCLAERFSYTDLHFYSMDWKDGRTHSLNESSNFLYLSVFWTHCLSAFK